MLGAPHVKTVRGVSDFGYSYVYVIFEDGTDLYWARSRTLEYLSGVLPRLPEGVKTELGPDATGWAGSSSTRWSTRPASTASPSCAPIRTGICATTCKVRAGRRRGRADRRLHPAVPGQPRSQPPAGLRHSDQPGGGRGPRRQQRDQRTPARVRRHRVHGARPRLRPVHRRFREHRALRQRTTAPPIRIKDVGEVVHRSRSAPRRRRPERQGRSGLRHRRHAQRRERAGSDRPGQGEAQGDRARPAGGRQDRSHLRSLGADSSHHQQRAGDDPRSGRHGGADHPRLPVAFPQRGHSRSSPCRSRCCCPSFRSA